MRYNVNVRTPNNGQGTETMTFAVIDSSSWDKNDYLAFAQEYYNYVLQVSRMDLSKKQKNYCDKIIETLSEITSILVYSGPQIGRQKKKQIDACIRTCNLYAIGIFNDEINK